MIEIVDTATTVLVIGAIVEVLKRALSIPSNFVPLVSVIIGIGVGALAAAMSVTPLLQGVWLGLVAGLMASGTYDVIKKTANF